MMVRRKKHHDDHEEHPSEAWLVAFADMMTLLMVTFLMMFAISSLDLKKFQTFEKAFKEGLGKNTHQLPAQGAPPEGTPEDVPIGSVNGTPTPTPSPVPNPTGPNKLQVQTGTTTSPKPVKKTPASPSAISSPAPSAPPVLSKADLAALKAQLEKAVDKAGLAGNVQVALDPRGLVLYVTSGVLFDPGKASVRGGGVGLLDGLGPVLNSIGNDLVVEGHTDSTPIHTKQFPSNWELSTTRATQVLRYLEDHDKVAADRLSASGYADTKPRDKSDTTAARALNRRVDIVVLAGDPPPAPAPSAPASPAGTPAPTLTPSASH